MTAKERVRLKTGSLATSNCPAQLCCVLAPQLELGLAPEASAGFLIAQRSKSQNLDRNIALKLLVARQIHHTHATRTNLPSDTVVGNEFANHSLNTRTVRGCYVALR